MRLAAARARRATEPPMMVCDPFWEIEGATDLDVTETVEE
jgi:hypothetical protein